MPFQTSLSPSPVPRPPPPSSTFSSPPLVSTILHPPRPTSDSILRTRTSSRKMHSPSTRSSGNRRARSVTAYSTGDSDFSMEEYTFDLAKLGQKFGRSFGEKESDVKTPEKERDEIGSKDDGPADFTINLGKWMRGTEGWRKDEDFDGKRQGGKEEGVLDEQDDSGEDGGDEDALSETENERGVEKELADESEFVPLSTSTPTGLQKRAYRPAHQDWGSINEEEGLELPQSPHLSVEERQDRAAEEVFKQISALQAEVERMRLEAANHQVEKYALEHQYDELAGDYDNIHTEIENQKSSKEHLERLLQEERETNAKIKAAMQEKDRPMTPGSRVGSLRARFEPKVQELSPSKSDSDLGRLTANARFQSLEADLKASQEEVLRYREDSEALRDAATSATNKVLAECEAVKESTNTTITSLETKLQASKDDVLMLKDQAKCDHDKHRKEIDSILSDLESCKLEASKHQRSAKIQEQQHISAIEDLNEQLRNAKASATLSSTLKNELEHVQEQLAETRRIVDAIEEENDRLTQKSAQQAQDMSNIKVQHEKVSDDLASKTRELTEALTTIETLKAKLANVSNDLESKTRELTQALTTVETLKADLDSILPEKAASSSGAKSHDLALETEHQSHQQVIADLKKEQESSLASLRAKILRAGEGMHKREERLAKSHQEEIVSLRQCITDLESRKQAPKSPPASPCKNNAAEVDEMRNAILSLSRTLESTQSSLSTTQATLIETQATLTGTQSSLAAVHQELDIAKLESQNIKDANAAVNAELEAKFKTTIEKREREWRRRVELLLRERDKMAKVLMVGWGKEEMGVAEAGKAKGQAFRYRFVDRG